MDIFRTSDQKRWRHFGDPHIIRWDFNEILNNSKYCAESRPLRNNLFEVNLISFIAKFCTYILKSKASDEHYFGHTSNLKKRLAEHNLSLSAYTKKFIPRELIYFEEFESRSEAMILEKLFKTLSGYHWLKIKELFNFFHLKPIPLGLNQ